MPEKIDQLTHLLTTYPILNLADPNTEFTISTDACMEGLGEVLLQDKSIIAYESRKLKINERNYVVYDIELVVFIHALKMWRHYLLGKKFILITNHISLKYLFSQPDPHARKARWMAFLSEFDFNIKNIKGKENKIVDALSKHPYNLMEVAISSIKTNFLDKIKNSLHKDPKYLDMQQKL